MQILKSGYVKGKFYLFFFFFFFLPLLWSCYCLAFLILLLLWPLSPLLLLLKVFVEMLHRGVKIVGAIETKLLKFWFFFPIGLLANLLDFKKGAEFYKKVIRCKILIWNIVHKLQLLFLRNNHTCNRKLSQMGFLCLIPCFIFMCLQDLLDFLLS